MKRTSTGVAVCIAVVLLFATLLVESEIAGAAFQTRKPGISALKARKVEELFNRNCARCYGADGRGDTPLGHMFSAPDFTDPGWWVKNNKSNRNLASTLARGKVNMPAFGKKLKRDKFAGYSGAKIQEIVEQRRVISIRPSP